MVKVRPRGEDVRRYIVEHVEAHPRDIAKQVGRRFGISRQAVSVHLRQLTQEGFMTATGATRDRVYRLAPLSQWQRAFSITPALAEDVVWSDDVSVALGALPDNATRLWQHGFTEMFNNAIDHSEGTQIHVHVRRTAASTEMLIADDGVGIFRKIQRRLRLLDERHAVLELAKGKLTTDPKRHSGEGIFFTSRMFDVFQILSGDVFFSHQFGEAEDWVLETTKASPGTSVFMRLGNHTSRTTKKVFDQFATPDEFRFSKTVVPVRLAQYGDAALVSRSQAKRLLARVELFKSVIFDFKDVTDIGQAFADEIFRVFALSHPEIEIATVHANSAVKRMIGRVTA